MILYQYNLSYFNFRPVLVCQLLALLSLLRFCFTDFITINP